LDGLAANGSIRRRQAIDKLHRSIVAQQLFNGGRPQFPVPLSVCRGGSA
jgi:hypothetical protein